MVSRAATLSILLVAAILFLPHTSAKTVSNESVAAKPDLYWVRNTTICALLVKSGDSSSEAAPDATPNLWSVFSSAKQLPLRECRHLHDFVVVYRGRYTFLSNITDIVSSFHGRNFSLTFCVDANYTIRFSCYRVRDRNGESYFVAPTEYKEVLIRGPVSQHECPQAFQMLDYAYLPLIQDKRQCATFLTVSSYAVRTASDECARLYRYTLFSDYPQVWNGCQRYTDNAAWWSSYDWQFSAFPEPWNYPTQEEVSRCADYTPRVACTKMSVDSKANTRYLYAGRDMGEMMQNKMDGKSCQSRSTGSYGSSDAAGGYHVIYYKGTVRYITGGGIALIVVAVVLRILCALYCSGLCKIRPKTPRISRERKEPVSFIHLPSSAIPMPPPPPPRPDSSDHWRTAGATPSAPPSAYGPV